MNKICASAGCRKHTRNTYCDIHQKQFEERRRSQAQERARRSSQRWDDQYKSFYSSSEWRKLRDKKIKKDPLCQQCKNNGFINAAMDIDHIIEIKDDWTLRLDISNLQSLCRSCHSAKTHAVRKQRQNNPPDSKKP